MADKHRYTEKDTASGDSNDPPPYGTTTTVYVEEPEKLGFWTRMGCTLESFKRREIVGENQLNETLKTRHLHMIAIGGSIGAGLFMGSGSALSRGVSISAEWH